MSVRKKYGVDYDRLDIWLLKNSLEIWDKYAALKLDKCSGEKLHNFLQHCFKIFELCTSDLFVKPNMMKKSDNR